MTGYPDGSAPGSSREDRMRILPVIAAVVALGVPARAQQSDALRQCAAANLTAEQRLANCTAVIEAGQETRQNLAIAYERRGNAHLNMRDHDRALADFDEAAKLDPKSTVALNSRGFTYEAKGQHDRAIADYDQAIALDPKFVAAFINRGMAYRNKGRYDTALQDLERALSLNPGHPVALFDRALVYMDKAQWDFEAYQYEGRYEDLAIRDYDEVIRRSPKNAAAFNNRANALLRRRLYDRALQDYEEALRLDPNNAQYFRNRGNAYRITGERDRGLSQGAQSETRRRKQKAN